MSSARDLRRPAAEAASAAVVALHCSGADGSQWRRLGTALGAGFTVAAPTFIGCGDVGPWHGRRAFMLADEAAAILDLVDRLAGPVHLVGHSYGGGVALKVAAARPDRMASLSLYEPTAFHLLRELGPDASGALAEIEGVATAVSAGLVSGAYQAAAATFIDYWGGGGAWAGLRPRAQAAMLRWLAKAPLDFRALLGDDTSLAALSALSCPILVMRGEHAPAPSRLIAEAVAQCARRARLEVIPGAGHMGPMTHPAEVLSCIVANILGARSRRAEAATGQPLAA